jgi:hypothetical protein
MAKATFRFSCTDGTLVEVKAKSKRIAKGKALAICTAAGKTLETAAWSGEPIFSKQGSCKSGNKPHEKGRGGSRWLGTRR